jgi:hypothetical protein
MGVSSYNLGDDYIICTSLTRPSDPYEGLMIFETDTDRVYVHLGIGGWKYVSGGNDPMSARAYRSTSQTLVVSASVATLIQWNTVSWDYGTLRRSRVRTASC